MLAPDASGRLAIKIQLDTSSGTPVYYVNHAEVSSGQHDFSITAARVPGMFTPAEIEALQASGKLTVAADAQLVFAPTLLPLLIAALEAQLKKYETSYGRTVTTEMLNE